MVAINLRIFTLLAAIFSANYSFAGTVDTAQRILNQLGYNAGVVDGLYGGKTKRALEAFYADNGETFDGKLDANEVIDLETYLTKNILTLGKQDDAEYRFEPHQKSKYVDYSVKHEFTYEKGQFFVDKLPRYASLWKEFYGKPPKTNFIEDMKVLRMRNYRPQDCLGVLHDPLFVSRGKFNDQDYRDIYIGCMGQVMTLVHDDVVRGEKNGSAVTYFFDTLAPHWIENDSQLKLPKYREEGESFLSEQNVVENFMFTYIWFSDWYGTSDELDQKFKSYFHKFERSRIRHIKSDYDRKFINKCPDDLYRMRPNWNGRPADKHLVFDACKQEFYPLLYAYMGVRFQDNNYINEALFFFKHNAKYTFEEGVNIEVTRGALGPGYAHLTSHLLDRAAFALEQFTNTNAYTIEGGGKYNTTVGELILGGIDAYHNPEKYFKYAKLGKDAYISSGDYREPPDIGNPAHYRLTGSILSASKSGKWNKYLTSKEDLFATNYPLYIDPYLMAKAYNFKPSIEVE